MESKLNAFVSKKKSVKDLIRFISNRTDNSIPNFSLLIGAGASVTSGIRSGQTLISDWKNEILAEEGIVPGSADDYFCGDTLPVWYDVSNPYSCLFEKRYDLQRQRRIFVEKEVTGKTPSIGYAYLVKLIEKIYFNTVFTTNFDDLLNEAFNRFSLLHPIVCAHDSSIAGVSVTSKAPKIIKLHGDYLFDNIKATVNETQELAENMKKKFQEFAKDFGLIVVGYGGQDKSIMNILTDLLKGDEAFKNGIYWCIRKGESDISQELQDLLTKDRVFFVEIDGFDELMAELNLSLNAGKLPIDDEFLGYEHQKRIVRELTDNSMIQGSASKILKEDCKRLNSRVTDSMMNDFVNFVKERQSQEEEKRIVRRPEKKTMLKPLSAEQKNVVDEINSLAFVFHNTDKALQFLSKYDIFSMDDSLFKKELLEMSADLSKALSDEDISNHFDELIRLNPTNVRYYMIAANRSVKFEQKRHYFELAKNKFNNDYYVHNRYADFIVSYCTDIIDHSSLESELDSAEHSIEISLKLNPSVTNEARVIKVKLYKIKYHNKRDVLEAKSNQLCDELFAMDPHSPITQSVLSETNDERFNEVNLRKAIDFYLCSDDISALEETYMNLSDCIIDKKGYSFAVEVCNQYESDFKPSYDYLLWKANKLVENELFDEALDYIKDIQQTKAIIKLKMRILSFQEKYDELKELYESCLSSDLSLKKYYYELSHRYREMSELIKEQLIHDDTLLSKEDLADYSYALLQLEEYSECMKILKPYYDNPSLRTGTIIVNYLLAKKRSGTDVQKKITEVLNNKYLRLSDVEKVGAYALSGNKNDMYMTIKKVLSKEPLFKYSIKYWPVMREYQSEQKFKHLIGL